MTDCDGPQGETPSPAPLRCLWLAREIPFPSNTGDRIYSAQLAIALAQTNVALTYLGLGGDLATSTPQQSNICWVAVPGRRKSNWRALFSSLPLVSAAHATREARAALERQLLRTWDVIVLDHYGTAWALERVKTYAAAQRASTVLVHITHNHEERLSRDLFIATPWSLRKCVLYLNYRRIRHWERRLASEVNLVSTITEEDRLLLIAQSTRPNYIVLTPGYGGLKIAYRELTSNTPRHTLLVGSFQWGVKEQNLRKLLSAADSRFAENGIQLHVVGSVPQGLIDDFQGRLRATTLHGFIDDLRPFLDHSRLALVPEVVGGGFKLKFLDYIFGRMPIATITDASAGLPEVIRCSLIHADTMETLVDEVINKIDDLVLLNTMQQSAFEAASKIFHWSDRGHLLRAAIDACVYQRA